MLKAILDQFPDAQFGVTLVWLDMLKPDSQPAARRAAEGFRDPRVRHFHDPRRLVGTTFAREVFPGYLSKAAAAFPKGDPTRLQLESRPPDSPVWDIYLFYGSGTTWKDTPPRPLHWIKQLYLDPEGMSLLWKDDFGRVPRLADLMNEIGATAREWLASPEVTAPGKHR